MREEKNNKELGIYVHIPFCKKKCDYCDFISFCNKDEFIEKYVRALLKEIKEYNEIKIDEEIVINTIYIGGGTPSYINEKYIELVLNEIKNKFNILKDCEITIEVNPGTVNYDKLKCYYDIGINRLSIGLQSTNDKLLQEIGRIHNLQGFLNTYELARNIGFKNINVDLMLGLPNQILQDLINSLDVIIKLDPEHISVYSLILEERTILYEKIQNKELYLPNEELERQMYWYVKDKLELSGYIHYEISNFAKKGFESKHNMNCWKQNEYIGFGLAAHSYLDNVRKSNIVNLEKFIQNILDNKKEKNVLIEEMQNIDMKKKEYMLLGLRKIDGVNIRRI